MKLNLGCGTDLRNGFINIDIDPMPDIDHQIDVSNLDDVCDDDAAEHILALDVLQTFSYRDVINVAQHWADKLKPGGTIQISVPDVVELAGMLFNQLMKPDDFLIQMYGRHEHDHDFNKTGFDRVLVKSVLEKVGLVVTYSRITNTKIVVTAVKPNE